MLVIFSRSCLPVSTTRPTAVSNSGRLVTASRPRNGSAHATNRLHQLYTTPTFRAATRLLKRSRVMNPLQPHWFFSSSIAFSASACWRYRSHSPSTSTSRLLATTWYSHVGPGSAPSAAAIPRSLPIR